MTRFTWHRFRVQAAVACTALVIAAVVMWVTGSRLTSLYHTLLTQGCPPRGCVPPGFILDGEFGPMQHWMSVFLLVIPAVIGVFWGAPLVAREFETGTYRLAWTQSVTTRRWLAVKLAVLGLASTAVAGLLSLMATWWMGTYNNANAGLGGWFAPGQFDVQGLVPAGYAAFAFAVAVTAGVLIRRTVPAMAVGLAAFAGVRYAIRYWVRPRLIAPVQLNLPLTYGGGPGFKGSTSAAGFSLAPTGPTLPGAWVYSAKVLDKAGHTPTQRLLKSACSRQQVLTSGCVHRLAAKLHNVIVYQPASRYWLFQACEALIFTGLALLLALFCLWWINRHRDASRRVSEKTPRAAMAVPG